VVVVNVAVAVVIVVEVLVVDASGVFSTRVGVKKLSFFPMPL
jgi:hypothetical protein